MMELRPYQRECLDATLAAMRNKPDVLIQAATGAGKTIFFSALIRHCMEHYKMRIGVLAHREQLIRQAQDKLVRVWPEGMGDIGLACASVSSNVELERPVVIGSPQTLAHRLDAMPPLQMLIVDECHRMPPKNAKSQYGDLISRLRDYYPKMRLIGVTATPFRLGHGYIYGDRCRAGAKNWFDDLTYSISIRTLQDAGYLVPLLPFGIEKPGGLDAVKKSAGDFNLGELSDLMSADIHIGSAVNAVRDYAAQCRHIVVFGVSIEHAELLKKAFAMAGYHAGVVHSKMAHRERMATLDAFDRGDLQVVCNVGVLTEGWDCTSVDCMVMCRPTMSPALFVQMVGRGLRTHEGKSGCMLLDLSGNWERHGDPNEPKVTWGRMKDTAPKPVECPECRYMNRPGAMKCKNCGARLHEEKEGLPCPHCGEPNAPAAIRCCSCDGVLKTVENKAQRLTRLTAPEKEEPFGIRRCAVHGEPTVNTDFVSRNGNRMMAIRMLCDVPGHNLPISVSSFLDLEGNASVRGREKARAAWRQLTGTIPPQTLDEAGGRIEEIHFPESVLVRQSANGYFNVERWA